MSPQLFILVSLSTIVVLIGWLMVRLLMGLRRSAVAAAVRKPEEHRFECPHCSQHIAVGREFLGTAVACPTCTGEFNLPLPHGWPAGARGLPVMAVGAWMELVFRVYPIVSRSLGLRAPAATQSLGAQMAWPEICMILGTLVSMAGLGMCLRGPVPARSRTPLVVCLLLQCGVVVAELLLLASLNLKGDNLPEQSAVVSVYGLCAHVASYVAAIVLLLFLRRVSADWGVALPNQVQGGVRLPTLLAAADLLMFLGGTTSLLSLIGGNAGGSALWILLGLAAFVSWGRLFWLFSFGKCLNAFARAAKGDLVEGKSPR